MSVNNAGYARVASISAGLWAIGKRDELADMDGNPYGKALATCYLTGIIDASAIYEQAAADGDAKQALARLDEKLAGYLGIGGE